MQRFGAPQQSHPLPLHLPGSVLLYCPPQTSLGGDPCPALVWALTPGPQRFEFLPVYLGEPGGEVSWDLQPILFSCLISESRPRWQEVVHVYPVCHPTWPSHHFCAPSTFQPWARGCTSALCQILFRCLDYMDEQSNKYPCPYGVYILAGDKQVNQIVC